MLTARPVVRILSAWGFPAAVVLAAIAVNSQNTSVSQTANHLAYDPFVALDSKLSLVPADVLLVYAGADLEQHPEEYLQLVRRLRELGAAGLGIVALDTRRWTPEQLLSLTHWKDLVVGHVTGDSTHLPKDLTRSTIDLLHSSDGIYRRYEGLRASEGIASLAAQMARSLGGDSAAVPRGDFGVRFCGPPESLPHVAAEKILRGEVTAALVRDRAVLIGRPAAADSPGLATPTTGRQRMSVLEFHGQALNTLLATRPLTLLSSHWQWPMYVMAAIIFPACGRRVGLSLAMPLFLAVWTVQAIVTWLLLWRLQIWIPLVSLMLVEVIGGCWSFDRRMRFSERAWQLLRRRGFSVSPRYQNPPSLRAGEAPWTYITSLLQQLFPLDRVALLRVGSSPERLELVAGESAPGVLDSRRDLNRQPYAEAIRRRAAVRIDRDGPFFAASDEQTQYVVPLFHAGQLRGVLIVALSTTAHDKIPGFAKQVTDVGEEVASWLARYDNLSMADAQGRRWWLRWATPNEAATFERLQSQLRTIERRLHQADQVVEQASFGKAVFDLSGAVVTMNATMYRLLHACHIVGPDTHLLQVLRALTRRDMSECRDLIRRVVIKQQRERIVVSDPTGDQPLVLIVQPVFRSEQLANDMSELQAFNVQGIHLEVIQGEVLGDVQEVREHMAEQTLATVYDTLADVSALSSLLSAELTPQERHQIAATFDRARVTVQRCQAMLANGQSEDLDVLLPVEIGTMVKAAVSETRALAEQFGATIATDVPRDLPDAVANPHRLRQVISTALAVMVEYARENSLISVSARNRIDQLVITIENEGCGVALDRLVAGRRSSSEQSAAESSRLLAVRDWLLLWGGDLQVDAELGEGAAIRICLKHFDWSDPSELTAASDSQQFGPV